MASSKIASAYGTDQIMRYFCIIMKAGSHTYHNLLKQYWGYTAFREKQEEVIDLACKGNDVLALFPTGGGKSIVFQISGLARGGLCIVVSPLIALMKDQVENLLSKKVKAVAVYSGMTHGEILRAYEKCRYGGYRFLYISPERLASSNFLEIAPYLPVSLIAVDEAHCISQWGYDFRPSYLKVAELRKLYPSIPVLALTATATPVVAGDIQQQLQFSEKRIVQRSFVRPNLTYFCYEREDKYAFLLKIVSRAKASGIVYVRNRKQTVAIADILRKRGFPVSYYHAGLPMKMRAERQDWWTNTPQSVMVATNAFGMGIDKPDVRFVVHVDIPDSLEAYFQEAGRAGRDGASAYAFLIYSKQDISNMKRQLTNTFPQLEYIKNLYEALGNYFQVPIGSCKGRVFDFELSDFCKRYKLQPGQAYSALNILELAGYISVGEAYEKKARIKFLVHRDDLYRFQVDNHQYEPFLKLLLRTYTGIFTDYVKIDERHLAKIGNTSFETIIKYLQSLSKIGVLRYIPRKESPIIVYNEERLDRKSLRIPKEVYSDRKKIKEDKLKAILNYIQNSEVCRTNLLVGYFGEKHGGDCGECDCCKRGGDSFVEQNLVHLLQEMKQVKLEEIAQYVPLDERAAIKIVRKLIDRGVVVLNDNSILSLRRQKGG